MEEKLLQQAYEKSKDYLYEDSSRFNLLSILWYYNFCTLYINY